MTSFSLIRNQALEQGQVMAAVNSRKKVKKRMTSNVRNGLKFGKICKKHLMIKISGTVYIKLHGIY